MSQIGKSLPGKYGLNLGHETGHIRLALRGM